MSNTKSSRRICLFRVRPTGALQRHRRSAGVVALLAAVAVGLALGSPAMAADCFDPQGPLSGIFADVEPGSMFDASIQYASQAGLVRSCGNGFFCPGEVITRKDMAIWIELFINTPYFNPPPATGYFVDVPADNCYACWIEELYDDGITSGCGTEPSYCPHRQVSRAEMAVFIVRAMEVRDPGSAPLPSTCQGYFADVPCPAPDGSGGHWAWKFIEKIYELGITVGCSASPLEYCPESGVTRAQMAVFVGRADLLVGN